MDRHVYTVSLVPLPDSRAHPNGRKAGECYLCGHPADHPVHIGERAPKPDDLDPLLRLSLEDQFGFVPGENPKPKGLTLEDFKKAADALPPIPPELDFVAIRAHPESIAALREHEDVVKARELSAMIGFAGIELIASPTLPQGHFAKMNRAELAHFLSGRFREVQIPDFEAEVSDDDPTPMKLISLYGAKAEDIRNQQTSASATCPRCAGIFGQHRLGCPVGHYEAT